MHNDDTTLVIVEYDKSENLTITHEDKIVEMVEKEKTSQISTNQAIETAETSQENTSQEEGQTDEEDFMNEFQANLSRHLPKKFSKQKKDKLKFWIQKIFKNLFERYSVTKK